MQDRESFMTNSSDINVTRSKHLELVIPVSRIASLSSGEFIGMVADNPDQEIDLKAFCAKITNDHAALKKEEDGYRDLPVVKVISEEELLNNYIQVRRDVTAIIRSEVDRITDSPDLAHLMIN
jgi:TusA-related sulfurtransferase